MRIENSDLQVIHKKSIHFPPKKEGVKGRSMGVLCEREQGKGCPSTVRGVEEMEKKKLDLKDRERPAFQKCRKTSTKEFRRETRRVNIVCDHHLDRWGGRGQGKGGKRRKCRSGRGFRQPIPERSEPTLSNGNLQWVREGLTLPGKQTT